MLDGRGRVRIVDFGLAMRTGDRVREIAGTPAYMAPEQVAGGVVTERTDLYALGLVFYEVFTGHRVFEVRTLAERARVVLGPRTLAFQDDIDPAVPPIVRTCLAFNPGDRPPSASRVAAQLPGGDAIAAALAEGRVLPPDVVAAAPTPGTIAPALAWTVLAFIVAGVVAVGAAGGVLTFTPADMPKPPEVLAEKAEQILSSVGQAAQSIDREYWFESAATKPGGRVLRFVYRTSPEQLVPQNFFHYVTQSDPPMDVTGMSTVILDPSGRLVTFTRLASTDERPANRVLWADLFADAGIVIDDYEQAAGGRRPLVPHDALLRWVLSRHVELPATVSAATLAGRPVYFDVVDRGFVEGPPRGVLSFRRSARGEEVLSLFVVIIFTATIVMVRSNLRAGEGDLQGARRLALFVAGAGLLSTVLRAHHVPNPTQELLLTLSICGWVLVWGGFSWLSYVAFEPHVRRLWPRSIISWTRVLAGRVRDPLVGRDVLLGLLAGVLIVGTSVVRIHLDGDGPSGAINVALDSLRSPRYLLSRVIFAAVDGIQYALGAFFVLLFLRLIVRKSWLAAIVLVVMYVPVSGNNATVAGVLHAAGGAALAVVVFLQIGLLAGVAMLMSERLLTHLPLTLDFNVWYAGSSIIVMLLVLGLAVWACGTTIRRATTQPFRPK